MKKIFIAEVRDKYTMKLELLYIDKNTIKEATDYFVNNDKLIIHIQEVITVKTLKEEIKKIKEADKQSSKTVEDPDHTLTDKEKKIADIIHDLGLLHISTVKGVADAKTDTHVACIMGDFIRSVNEARVVLLKSLSDQQVKYLSMDPREIESA